MVTAFVAGLILAGPPQERSFEYKPKNHAPFTYAARISEMFDAKTMKMSEDGATFTWTGTDTEIWVNESDGVVHIKSSKEILSSFTQMMELFDVPLQKCRITLTMKRANEADQSVSADVPILNDVKIGGGFGATGLAARARLNGDGTYTMVFNMSRDFGTVAPKRESTIVLRMKSGEKVAFSSLDKKGETFTQYAIGESAEALIKGGVAEPGVSFEATVSEVPKL